MGIYYLYVCCDDIDGSVVAQFNPQHGFGGLKWGEFVGTNVGTQMRPRRSVHARSPRGRPRRWVHAHGVHA